MLLKSDLDVQQTDAGLLNKISSLAAALGVTRIVTFVVMNMIILACAT